MSGEGIPRHCGGPRCCDRASSFTAWCLYDEFEFLISSLLLFGVTLARSLSLSAFLCVCLSVSEPASERSSAHCLRLLGPRSRRRMASGRVPCRVQLEKRARVRRSLACSLALDGRPRSVRVTFFLFPSRRVSEDGTAQPRTVS